MEKPFQKLLACRSTCKWRRCPNHALTSSIRTMLLTITCADALRLYLLFIGPVTASTPWQDAGVEGVYRFLQRVWRLLIDEESGKLSDKLTDAAGTTETELWRELHQTIKQVTEDTESIDKMNTAISQMMIFVNTATQAKSLPKETLKIFLHLLSPYAPHIAQELWQRPRRNGVHRAFPNGPYTTNQSLQVPQ